MNDEYKKEINAGFKGVQEAIFEMSNCIATLTERVENVRRDQKEFKAAMKEIEETKMAVEKNTQFRKSVVKAAWIVISVILTAGTLAALWGFGNYISSQ